MLVMFSCLLIGFILRKTKLAPENSASVMSKLELYIFLPAQIVQTFISNCTIESIVAKYSIILYGAIAIVVAILIGFPISRFFAKDRNQRKIFRYGLIFANFGFLGMAIVPQIMGDEGMYAYMLFILPINAAVYGWGINSLIPDEYGKNNSLLKRILNPNIISMAVGISLGLLGAKQWMPQFALTTMQNLSACMGPVAMILTGFIIGGYHIPSLLKNMRVYIITALRLIVLPMLIVGILRFLRADQMTIKVAMFAFASALGLNTVVIPAAYDADTTTGAAMALISHILGVVTIPLLYAILLQFS